MNRPRAPKRQVTGILLLDKPAGLTSNAALQRVRRLYRAEKAGHTGSLDPLATGLLPLCFGEATKLCAYLLDADKRYWVRARLGQQTTTGDAEGEIVRTSDPAGATAAVLAAVLERFHGPIRQTPPMYSALKHEGRRLYELARQGLEVARAPREVTIHELRLVAFDNAEFELEVRCSKGTYIRTLVEDIAAGISQCAHVTAMRRLGSGPFAASDMVTMERLEQTAADGFEALDALLAPPAAALAGWPKVTVDADRAFYLARGQAVQIRGAPRHGRVAVMDPAGALLGIASMDAEGRVAPRRWLATGA